jgi:uncharacterized membrane protein HdeD (DUF308 family)
VTIFWPSITATVLLYIVATWALVTGVLQIVAAIELREVISTEWLLGAAGAISVLVGLLLFTRPFAGAMAFVLLLGVYFVVLGLLLLAAAYYLRSQPQAV